MKYWDNSATCLDLADQEVPGSIHGSVVGIFCGGGLFIGMYELGVSLLLDSLPMFSPVLSSENISTDHSRGEAHNCVSVSKCVP